MFQAQAVKKLAHRSLNISFSGGQGGEPLFYLVKLKLVSRPMWISNCKKNLSSETTEYGHNL